MTPFMFVFVYLIGGCITGFVTRAINMNKGYEGGFAWGFLGILGVIYVLSKPDLYLSDSLSQIIEKNEAQTGNNSHGSAPSGWTCEKCGQVNPYYTGTCVCGNTRQSQEAKIQVIAAVEEIVDDKSGDQELRNLQLLKAYKDLLDAGVVSQDDFARKRQELLGLIPA